MSFLDDLIDVGSSALSWFGGNSTSASLARTATLGLALNQVSSSIKKESDSAKATEAAKDYGVREQVDPDTEYSVPVVYGDAFLGGVVTDAVLADDNMTMWYCITICEKTGILMSSQQPSVITLEEIYWNEGKLTFQADGITVAGLSDNDGNSSTKMNGLVKVYAFSGGYQYPIRIGGASAGNTSNANTIFPNWGSSHKMTDLVFALIKVTYNKEMDVTGLGNLEFHVKNTMKMPGDVLYDYMTNSRYGADIPPLEIYQS